MGIGMVLAADSDNADMILGYLDRNGENAFIIGEVAEGEGGLELC
jgi:phosphoribosylformylglycinamidine cyclo-ligase